MKAVAVVGANWGDEGKGLMVDYLCSQKDSIVVRHNGGAQAGHTVEMYSGDIRHVFKHHGSGTFRGAPTFLSKHFVVNPSIFLEERKQLASVKVGKTPIALPIVFADPRCMVTTPFDVAFNQMRETLRAKRRHGSCGCGFGETVRRYETGERLARPFPRLGELAWMSQQDLVDHFEVLHKHCQFLLQEEPELQKLSGSLPWKHIFDDIENTARVWSEEMRGFTHTIRLSDESVLPHYTQVVFEGAQGLKLSQHLHHHYENPHVTRSYTGTQNVVDICDEAGLGRFDVIYVSRWYATRHGAGPMPWELGFCLGGGDETNQPNDWQGQFRYGWLDFDSLAQSIDGDVRGKMAKRSVALTHMNSISDQDAFVGKGGKLHRAKRAQFEHLMRSLTGHMYRVNGKEATDVTPD